MTLVLIEKPANGDTTWPLKAAVLGLNEGEGALEGGRGLTL